MRSFLRTLWKTIPKQKRPTFNVFRVLVSTGKLRVRYNQDEANA